MRRNRAGRSGGLDDSSGLWWWFAVLEVRCVADVDVDAFVKGAGGVRKVVGKENVVDAGSPDMNPHGFANVADHVIPPHHVARTCMHACSMSDST